MFIAIVLMGTSGPRAGIPYQNEFIMNLKLSENDSEPSGVLLS